MAWGITKKEDEQKVGELEVQMTPWALATFFDLESNGAPKYQTLIDPPLLLRRSEIRPYRLDNIIRITARRQDADEIATQLENKVLLIGKQVVQMENAIPTHAATYPKGQSLQHFRQQDLSEIMRRTQSFFMQQKDGNIGIYSFKQSDRANARRLLLSLLDLSSRKIARTTLDYSLEQTGQAGPLSLALVPVFPDRGLHFRDRSKSFARAVLPIRRETTTISATRGSYHGQAEGISRKIASLVKDTDQQKEEEELSAAAERSSDPSTYWAGRQFKTSQTWWARLGLLLHESIPDKSGHLVQDEHVHYGAKGNTQRSSKQTSVFLRQVPGYETLLSYFEPNSRPRPAVDGDVRTSDLVTRKSAIVAHFMPSPFTNRGAKALNLFPALELTMLRRSAGGSEETELKIEGLRAITGEHHIDIPLPDRVVDLRLTRKIGAHASMPAVLADPQIQHFVAALKQSTNSKGPLQGTDVIFKMPGWMTETDSDIRNAQDGSLPEISVPYIFERFEQVQSTGFRKNIKALGDRAEHNAGIHAFNDNFPKNARLQYSEIDAGDMGGKHTEIAFKLHDRKASVAQTSEELEVDQAKVAQPQQHSGTLKSVLVPALAIADFVTRACKNEVTTWRASSGSERSDVSSRRNEESEVTSAEEAEHEETRTENAEASEKDVETSEEVAEVIAEDAQSIEEVTEARIEVAEATVEDSEARIEDGETEREAKSDDKSK